MTGDFHDFLFAQRMDRMGLNSPDFIFAFWGSVAWAPLISFYFSGAQPHLGAPQGDHSVWHIFWHSFCIYPDIPSDILSGMLPSTFSDGLSTILSGIFSGIHFGILSGICSDVLFGNPSGTCSGPQPHSLWHRVHGLPASQLGSGSGPAVPTEIWRSGRGKEKEQVILLKSRDPHLAGGEECKINPKRRACGVKTRNHGESSLEKVWLAAPGAAALHFWIFLGQLSARDHDPTGAPLVVGHRENMYIIFLCLSGF